MTLAECIARHHDAQPAPIAPHDVLTPLGDATVALYRLKAAMAALEPRERAEIVGLAASELGIVAGTEPAPPPAEPETTALCLRCGEGYAAQDFDCPACRRTA
jgi:hypothetical protein